MPMTVRYEMDPEDKAKLETSGIPEHTQGALLRYIEHGLPPGDFLMAVLRHDLFDAVGHADGENQKALVAIVKYIYNYCPGNCHGSREAIKDWLSQFRDSEEVA